jgi:hypothetical protein
VCVRLFHALLETLGKARWVQQIARPQSYSRRLVTVGWPNPASGRTDFPLPFSLLLGAIERPVDGQCQVRAIGNHEIL